ncbi:MAG: sulfurtransferase [Campylobacterales bacterium]|nr:sulfurtransferase [Campylobacterales bacterium]
MFKTLLLSTLSLCAFAIEPLVDSAWLESNLGNPKLRIVEIADAPRYETGHIPNAARSDIDAWREAKEGYIAIKPLEAIEAEIHRLGIDQKSEVLLYAPIDTPKDQLKTSYIFWALHYHGITDVGILDGGKAAYKGALQTKTTPIAPSSYSAKRNNALFADRSYVSAHLGKLPMIDARPGDKYLGITPTDGVKRNGHIAGAMSYPWNYSVTADHTLKSSNDLRTLFGEGYGLDPKKEVLVYCTGGLETSFNYYVLAGVLGYKHVRLYDASMKEWGNRNDTAMTQYRFELFSK